MIIATLALSIVAFAWGAVCLAWGFRLQTTPARIIAVLLAAVNFYIAAAALHAYIVAMVVGAILSLPQKTGSSVTWI